MGSHSDPVSSKPPPAPPPPFRGKFTYHCDDLVVHADFCIKHIRRLWTTEGETFFLNCSNCIWGSLCRYFSHLKAFKRGMLNPTAATLTQTCTHSLTDGLVNWNINYCAALASVWEAPESVCTCWSCRIWVFGELLTCRRKGLMLHSFRTSPEGIGSHRQQISAQSAITAA